MTTVDLRDLYHGIVDRDLPYVLANGVSPSSIGNADKSACGGSFWCVYEVAEWWAWVRHYAGHGNPVVLKVPLSRFDPKFLKPDDVLFSLPESGDVEQLCADSLILCGGIRYETAIFVTNDDVIHVVNKTEYQ